MHVLLYVQEFRNSHGETQNLVPLQVCIHLALKGCRGLN
ncbi:MAG: hypothetical protein JETT_3226 [Candidatus Jettenia ecosi]|uniref:Uncharacterized protein n=1 Tax=Candidatus Jettenia ecosi TaxID=2494326 RepID=A0A533Q7A7_9BACT|nr:MAG: hypothetical protein JETT_3226 [Candidatus Jettenia ecosi]